MARSRFLFLDPGELADDDLTLVLEECDTGFPPDYVPIYRFVMRHTHTGLPMGGITLRIGHTEELEQYAGHIGYGVDARYRGRRYAARSCRLLLPLAARHGFDEVWITCNPDNWASRRTCELAGATFVEIVDLPEWTDMYQEGERQKCRYLLKTTP